MSDEDLLKLQKTGAAEWRVKLARWVESRGVQLTIIAAILLNAAILGLETSPTATARWGTWLMALDRVFLAIFCVEIGLKLIAYRGLFWRSGWNWFDFLVIAIALMPGAGVWAVLRSLRVLRVLRLLTMLPQLKRVVAAFLHAIPGLMGVNAVMAVFFYTAGVLATKLFGETHPEWFGSLGASLYTLFQVMTLESWSMGIVRPVMEMHPWAWVFFVPFIVIATFTILNLFIGIIVSTMQELSALEPPAAPKPEIPPQDAAALVARLEDDLSKLKQMLR